MSDALVEGLRIEAGRPSFGIDMDEETIPLEAGLLERAISTTKGCYVGQEIIIRILHRGGGRVAKRLARLAFDPEVADPPARGTAIFDGEREVGRITSAAMSPTTGHVIALGYVHRDVAEEGKALTRASGRTGLRGDDFGVCGIGARFYVPQSFLTNSSSASGRSSILEFLPGHPANLLTEQRLRVAADRARPEMQPDGSIRIGVLARRRSPTPISESTPSSSRSSRARHAAIVSPGSHLPPGNSHSPSRCVPSSRRVTRNRPSRSITAAATTMTPASFAG